MTRASPRINCKGCWTDTDPTTALEEWHEHDDRLYCSDCHEAIVDGQGTTEHAPGELRADGGVTLEDYGVAARDVVRQLTHDRDGLVVCPECGGPIGGTEGSQALVNPQLVDERELEIRNFITNGYRCDRHAYDVITPKPCSGESASNHPAGWVGVRVQYADELVRWVAVPEREVTYR